MEAAMGERAGGEERDAVGTRCPSIDTCTHLYKLWQAGEQYRAMILTDPTDEEALQH
nr:hypothetical protein [Ktedonobacteraceae bacterium]